MSIFDEAKPIPTMFRGRRYGSRLEARWAAFFHWVDWPAEYEPFDLEGWSPTFSLRGSRGTILVEVQPVALFNHQPVADRMLNAVRDSGIPAELLIVGTAPFYPKRGDYSLGWLSGGSDYREEVQFEEALLDFYCGEFPRMDFCHGALSSRGRITGRTEGGHTAEYDQPLRRKLICNFWNIAGDAVRWIASNE